MAISHVAEVAQTGHSCSCIECFTAGESHILHYYTIFNVTTVHLYWCLWHHPTGMRLTLPSNLLLGSPTGTALLSIKSMQTSGLCIKQQILLHSSVYVTNVVGAVYIAGSLVKYTWLDTQSRVVPRNWTMKGCMWSKTEATPTLLMIIRCLLVIYFLWLLGNYDETYGVIYEVIQGKFRVPLWAMKIARYVE